MGFSSIYLVHGSISHLPGAWKNYPYRPPIAPPIYFHLPGIWKKLPPSLGKFPPRSNNPQPMPTSPIAQHSQKSLHERRPTAPKTSNDSTRSPHHPKAPCTPASPRSRQLTAPSQRQQQQWCLCNTSGGPQDACQLLIFKGPDDHRA